MDNYMRPWRDKNLPVWQRRTATAMLATLAAMWLVVLAIWIAAIAQHI